jgi:hypothetical protein
MMSHPRRYRLSKQPSSAVSAASAEFVVQGFRISADERNPKRLWLGH